MDDNRSYSLGEYFVMGQDTKVAEGSIYSWRPKDNIGTLSTCERAYDCVVLGKSEMSACSKSSSRVA